MKKILGCLLGLLWAIPSHAELPAGYTQLEYIESTGTQYIDTGFSPDLNTKVDYKAQILEWGASNVLIGARLLDDGSANSARFYPIACAATRNKARTTLAGVEETFDLNTLTIYEGTFNPSENVSIVNNVPYNIPSSGFDKIKNNNIYLFATSGFSNSLYSTRGRLYYVDIYDNSMLVRNLIPAKRDSDDEIGMYDLVSGTFFENAGTGDFIAGPVIEIKIATTKYVEAEFAPLDTALANAISVVDNVVTQTIAQAGQIATLQNTKQTRPDDDDECPAGKKCLLVTDETGTPHWYEIIEGRLPDGYTELEYIESTGTQWIDTGYSVDYTTATHLTIKSDMLITSTSGYRLCGLGGANSQFYFGIQASSKFAYGDGETDKSTGTAQLNKWYSYEYSTKNGTFTVKDASDTVVANVSFGFSSNYGADRNIYLFAYNEAHSAKAKWTGKIKGYTIYYDNTIVLNLTPAKRNSDSAIGMYDMVSGTFFENAGTGSFIGGAPVFN